MAHYIRTNHSLKSDNDTIHCKSINKAKKESRELQKKGSTVSKSHKRTHRLHYTTSSR